MQPKNRPKTDLRLVEKTFKKARVYSGRAIGLRADEIILPDGKKGVREFLEHPGAVAVLPVLDDGRLLFVRQYRYPVGAITLEIPAGKLHSAGDCPLRRARAELREETGCRAGAIKHLLDFWPTPAFSNELLRVYLATRITRGRPAPDEDEFIRTEVLSFEKAWEMLRRGRIKDAKTIIALQAWKIKRLEK